MKLKIIKDDNPIMREKSKEVTFPLSNEDKKLLDDMLNYLKLSQDEDYSKKHHIRAGCGLAAIQLGILKRMFVVYYENKDQIIQYQLVNPVIIETSIKKCALQSGEGCLSVDEDHQGLAHRYFKIIMKAYDALQDKTVFITARGYDAIVLQHEFDHLNGLFYYDHINKNEPNQPLNDEIIL